MGLWEGSLFEKMGKNIPHSIAQVKLTNALLRLLPEGWFAYSESPILVNARTAPLPDAAIVRGEPDTYSTRGSVPEMSEIGLVIEVADSSLEKNLTVSLQTYAAGLARVLGGESGRETSRGLHGTVHRRNRSGGIFETGNFFERN